MRQRELEDSAGFMNGGMGLNKKIKIKIKSKKNKTKH